MKPGERIELLEVTGHGFALDDQKGKDLVFVAMGRALLLCGRHCAMCSNEKKSLANWWCFTARARRMTFAFAMRRMAGRRGRGVAPGSFKTRRPRLVRSYRLRAIASGSRAAKFDSPVALICGSLEMIEQTRDRLSQMGFRPNEILTNY